MIHQKLLAVDDASHVADARRHAGEFARAADFDDTDAGRLALVVTESATNIVKHAGHGMLLVRRLEAVGDGPADTSMGVEVIALDDGPGVDASAFADGHSTAGTAGNGLGALTRIADEFDWYSAPQGGSAFRMALWSGRRRPKAAYALGAVCIAMPGEDVCGDDWRLLLDGTRGSLLVCDGLGHGFEAARAAQAATALMGDGTWRSATDLLLDAHAALRATRGAAMSAATFDRHDPTLRFAGVGNVAAYVCTDAARRQLISHNGTVGHAMRKLQAFDVPWPSEALLVMHSDGLSSQWDLADFPGLADRHPALVAAMLFKAHWRQRDDVTVVVLAASDRPGP